MMAACAELGRMNLRVSTERFTVNAVLKGQWALSCLLKNMWGLSDRGALLCRIVRFSFLGTTSGRTSITECRRNYVFYYD